MQILATPSTASDLREASADLRALSKDDAFVFMDGMADVALFGHAQTLAALRNAEQALARGFRVDFQRPELGINTLLAAPSK